MSTISLEDFLRELDPDEATAVEHAYADALKALPLAALRAACGLTQKDVAKRLGISQAAVSKFEGRGDFLLSTLFKFVRTLGGTVDVAINVENSEFELEPVDDEGDIYFELIHQKAHDSSRPAPSEMSERFKQVNHDRGARIVRPNWETISRAPADAVPSFNFMAANDEAQPLAA